MTPSVTVNKCHTYLEVAVHDVVEVAVLYARNDLVEEPPRLVRVQLFGAGGGG